MVCVEWSLVSENTECSGTETERSIQPSATIQDCALACDGVSSMFLFSPGQNRCFCETAAAADGTCSVIAIQGWHLYKYGSEGRFLIISHYSHVGIQQLKFIEIQQIIYIVVLIKIQLSC